MPYTKETILPFIERQQQLYEDGGQSGLLQDGVAFLTGQTIHPPVCTDATAAREMGVFVQLLKLPDQWDDNDRLVLQLLADPLVWQHCRERFLQRVVPMLDTPGSASAIVLRFSYFTNYLQQRGCTTEEIGSILIVYSGDGNNFDLTPLKFTPLRKFLQDLIKSAEWPTVDAYLRTWREHGWNSLFFRLLSKGHPDREMEYLEHILHQPDKGFVNVELSRVLLQLNPDKYRPLIERSVAHLATLPDYTAQLCGYYLLAQYQPEQYDPLLLTAAYAYLQEHNNSFTSQDFRQQQAAMGGATRLPAPDVMAVAQLLRQDRQQALSCLDTYVDERKYLHPEVFQLVQQELGNQSVPLLLKAIDNDYEAKHIFPLLTQLDDSLYAERLWDFTLHKLKSVRTLVAVILADHPQALERAGALLQHKKAEQRLTAVQILCRLNTPEAKQLLQQALQQEINDDARDLMLETLGQTLAEDDDVLTAQQLVTFAKKRFKLSRPLEKWLDDSALPPAYLVNGTALTQDMKRFLLYRMSRVNDFRPDIEARPLLRLIDRSRSGEFAMHLFQLYLSRNGDAKAKYLLALAGLTGDDALAATLEQAVIQWISEKRLRMAEHGVGALALHGSKQALQTVEYLSRKYRVRKANIGAAALAGMQYAAAELGITMHELGDRIVPDFGFKGMFLPFEVKGDIYQLYIDQQFKPAVINNRQRKLKSIPVATPAHTKEAIKQLGKAIAETVKLQTARLEHFLVVQRKWEPAQWQQCFLQHPIMFVYATRLLWALYDAQDQLITGFQCHDANRLTDLHGQPVTIPAGASIRVLHPLYLSSEALAQWKQRFAEDGIEAVFPQLDRPVAAIPPQQADTTLVHDFEDIALESTLLNKHMEQKGWKLSEGSDGKYVYAYHKTDDENQLEVIVEMSSIYKEEGFRYKLGTLYFVDKTKMRQRWSRNPDKETDDCLLPLGHVPPVFYSEAITDIAVSRQKVEVA
ncbi:DUF4132 domain-containing protein [Chitinophaga oryzae]|uniref:DUF4132 domain-containing protein n=1 Tax=Chitinophaga oryzae TaxID=2725414 RepID=A0AAE6ZDA2_9BACT|nr:DUF4132 domain-containing protein [Chitinophaga oryzae]QJB30529.1 DUF4132 domain-containing protein [Chitinophaga oryzae]QJB37028.1 DUF4132 domain-containing protein [Chitinophaga oryzae]